MLCMLCLQDYAVYRAQHQTLEKRLADVQDALDTANVDKSMLLDYVQVGWFRG